MSRLVSAENAKSSMVVSIKGSACILLKDAEAERTLSNDAKGGKANVVLVGRNVRTDELVQDNPKATLKLDLFESKRYQLVDISTEKFASLMDDDGGTREDIPIRDGIVAREIIENFEQGEELNVYVTKLGSSEEIITRWEPTNAEAVKKAQAEQAVALAVERKKEEERIVMSKKLCAAAALGKLDQVKELIESGKVDVSYRSAAARGWCPLNLALYDEHEEVVRLLLQHGASVLVKTDDGSSSLHMAADKASADVVETILSKPGVDVNCTDDQGWTPLHVAANNGRTEIVLLLLKHKAAVDVRTLKNSWTPLHCAANHGHVYTCATLLANGADRQVKNEEGLTPLEQSVRAEQPRVKAILQYPLHTSAAKGDKRVICGLLSRGYSLEEQDEHGKTPVEYAGSDEIREIFARPEKFSEMGKTLAMLNCTDDLAALFWGLGYKGTI